ncbi:MAG TPA: RNA polymerase sigma factor [Patescibacteria group bacterium]|nr:RNA polymerase sigma factor [Patescibacteria group bacterium]
MSAFTITLNTDQILIQEYISGDRERAATEFVRRHQQFVYSVAYRYLRSQDDADDAAQETFIRALKNLHKFRGESSLNTWLYRITMNVCTNIQRKKRVRDFFGLEDISETIASDESTPAEQYEDNDFEKRFKLLLNQLPEKQRETFALRYFDELSYEEISQILGTSVGGLKANYFQAVKKLAVLLKNSDLLDGADIPNE